MGKPKKKKRKLSAYNKHMSREMKKGQTFKQAVASWKPGSKKSSPKKKAGKSNPKGGTRTMTKNSFNMNKIYGLIRKVAIFIPAIDIAMQPTTMQEKLWVGQKMYFGYDSRTRTFSWADLSRGWAPAVGAQVITRVIPAISKVIRGLF